MSNQAVEANRWLSQSLRTLLRDPVLFARHASGMKLRSYQQEAARAIVDSVVHRRGLTFVVIMSRQAGKNELQAQIECYLLVRFMLPICSAAGDPLIPAAEIVKASPTFKPQTENAMRRLERVLQANVIARRLWKRDSGYIYRVGQARIYFFSAYKEANVVGATASTLLECDEAQDVTTVKWDKDFADGRLDECDHGLLGDDLDQPHAPGARAAGCPNTGSKGRDPEGVYV